MSKILENGLRIYVLERTASPTFAGHYQFGVGGASDPKGRTGIAHLLEHMMRMRTENSAEGQVWEQFQALLFTSSRPIPTATRCWGGPGTWRA